MTDFNVLICGGGIAGVEGLLRLRRLAGDSVQVTLLSPEEHLIYRPWAVREPFAAAKARRYPVQQITADTDANWVRDRLERVDAEGGTVSTEGGRSLTYDALMLALGGRESSPYEHATLFSDRPAKLGFGAIVQEIDRGSVERVAFVLADAAVWPVPLYELALMTAARARSVNREVQITFITQEGRPLKAFGQAAGDAIRRLIETADIKLVTGVVARVPAPGLVSFGETQLEVDRVVTLPRIDGPAVPGIPAGTRWLVPIDERCVVPETGGRIFAAGDATDFEVKHGGIGAQQADTAAAGIAHLAGVGDRPPPIDPVIRAMLLTGGQPLYLSARVIDGLGWRSEVHEQPPWSADDKIVAEELGPYLHSLDLPPASSR